MNTNKINTGIFFISIGLYILLYNLSILNWSLLPVLAHLWPLFLISLGLQIIFNRYALAKILTIIITIGLIFVYGFNTEYHWFSFDNFPATNTINQSQSDSVKKTPTDNLQKNVPSPQDKLSTDSSTSIAYRQTINPKHKISAARLSANFEFATYGFEPLQSKSLMEMNLPDNDIFKTLSYEDNYASLEFDDSDAMPSSASYFSLNENTLWSVDIDAETSGDMNLSSMQIESLKVDSDANLTLTLDGNTSIQTSAISVKKLYIHLKQFENQLTILNASEVHWQKNKLTDSKVDIGNLQSKKQIILEVENDCIVYITE